MDSNISPNNTESNSFTNSSSNSGVRPFGINPFYYTKEGIPLRMEQVHTDKRLNENIQQQNNQALPQNTQPFQQPNIMRQNQKLHQNIMQNHPLQKQNSVQQQQKSRFLPNEDINKSQTNPINSNQPSNDSIQNNRTPRPLNEGQRIQMLPQVRVGGPQQPPRPPFNNPNSGFFLNQTNQSKIEAPEPQDDQIRSSLQNVNHPEHYNIQFSKIPSTNLTRKSSDLDIKPPGMPNINQISNEADVKPQMRAPLPRISDRTEIRSDILNIQAPSLNTIGSKYEIDESKNLSIESDKNKQIFTEKTENLISINTKVKERTQKVIKNNNITSGMVQNKIKYFEENDTAKKPLTPSTINATKKKEKIKNPHSHVIKNESRKEEYESGVDETPVIHPNLGSIFQVPRKVAKIPYLKSKKHSRKSKAEKTLPKKKPFEDISNKKQHQRSTFSNYALNSSRSYFYDKPRNRKNQKTNIYDSKEELLAFFENSKIWRKLSCYVSKTDKSTTKDKVVYKPTTNGDIPTPKKTPSKLQNPPNKNLPLSPTKTPLKSPGTPGTSGAKSLPKTPESPAPSTPLIKKVPMNKIQVGAAPSPNLKTVKSKVGSLMNTTHKPGGGNVKIESHKIDLSKVQPRTEAKNDQYKPSGGDKKIQQVKLQWNAKSKIGSLENSTYKPGGGDKKIESVKLDFKDKAKPKVGSKDNVKHTPGGGNVKIENQKLEFKAQSKVGSLDNVKHKPGGGDIKIFDDKTYLRQVSGNSSEGRASGTQAYKEFSVVREMEGRSAPGTPGRQTSVKIRKVTLIDNSEELPKKKKVTEVTVTSVTPKKEEKVDRSPTEVKVTYSKISSAKNQEPKNSVKLIIVPAKNDAPVLKPHLRIKDLSDNSETEKSFIGKEVSHDFDNTSLCIRNAGSPKQISGSPSLLEGKLNLREDSEMSRFLQDEIVTQEKIGEIIQERNIMNSKSNLSINQQHVAQLKELQTSSDNYKVGGNNLQFRFQNPNIKTDTEPSVYDLQSNYSNQNLQSEQILQNPSLVQNHPQNQQRPFFSSSFQDGHRISPPQENQSFIPNPRFQQNLPK